MGTFQPVGPLPGMGPDNPVFLTMLTLKTHTNDNDKDNNTGIWVEVVDNDGRQIAYIENAQSSNDDSTHYNDGETHQFDFKPNGDVISKMDCTQFQWRMGIQATSRGDTTIGIGDVGITIHGGNDTWDFDAWLTLTFGDGSTLTTDKLNQSLVATDGDLVWDDFH